MGNMFFKNRVVKNNFKPFGFYLHLIKQRQLSTSELHNILKKTNRLNNLNKDLLQKFFLKELNIDLINLTRESNLSSSRKLNKSLKSLLAEKLSSKLTKKQTKLTNTFVNEILENYLHTVL